MMDELQTLSVTRDATFASFRNLSVWVWRRSATPSMVGELRRALTTAASSYPAGAGIVTVVGRGVRVPSDDIRKQIVRACRDVTGTVRGGAVVYLNDDMIAPIVRGVVTGLSMIDKSIYPHAVFRSVPAGAEWLAQRMGTTAPSLDTIINAVEQARALRAPESPISSIPPR